MRTHRNFKRFARKSRQSEKFAELEGKIEKFELRTATFNPKLKIFHFYQKAITVVRFFSI